MIKNAPQDCDDGQQGDGFFSFIAFFLGVPFLFNMLLYFRKHVSFFLK